MLPGGPPCAAPPPPPGPGSEAGTDLSLPGLTLTRNRPYTGRWSDVLIPGQEEYLTGQMSSLWRLLYMTRSCGEGSRGRLAAGLDRLASRRLPLKESPCPSPPGGPAPTLPQPCGRLTVYEGVLCLEVVSYESFPTSNLYDGRKWMSGSWKPLKMDPGTGRAPTSAPRLGAQGCPRPPGSLPAGRLLSPPHLSSSPA